MIRLFQRLLLSAGLLICVGSSGCASIVGGGSHETVRITSNPSGATVAIFDKQGDEVHNGKTPFTVSLKRGNRFFTASDYDIRATKRGYVATNVTAQPHINGWYFGNIVFGGLVGMLVVDPATGAMWDLPNEIAIDLEKAPPVRKKQPKVAAQNKTDPTTKPDKPFVQSGEADPSTTRADTDSI